MLRVAKFFLTGRFEILKICQPGVAIKIKWLSLIL